MRIVRTVMFVAALVTPGFHAASLAAAPPPDHHNPATGLIDVVRQNTDVFRDVNNAIAAGYGPVLGCVTGPVQGAMGVHFVNPTLLMDGALDPSKPEALIYEIRNGVARLVGVEFIVVADAWHETHAEDDPPVLDGQLLNYNGSPNRFGLPSFFELHVWAWRTNPLGAYVDWNTQVTCEQHE